MAVRRKLSDAEAELELLFAGPDKETPKATSPSPSEPKQVEPKRVDTPKKAKPVIVSGEVPSMPDRWPNGSAVFRDKSANGGWPSPVREEERDGLLGRYVKRADGAFDVWRWKQGAYAYAGAAPDHVAAFSML